MLYLRYLAFLFGVLLLSWQLYSFFGVDEEMIRASLGNATPTKFIQVDEEELQMLHDRLDDMKTFPEAVLEKPRAGGFGRERGVFLPD
jgi:hypothetical protein